MMIKDCKEGISAENVEQVLKLMLDKCESSDSCSDCPCDGWLCDGELWVCHLPDVAIKHIANKLTRGVNDED